MGKHIRFSLNRNASPTTPDSSSLARYGILEGDEVFETEGLWDTEGKQGYPLSSVRLLPPACPSKIVCVGRNYVDHAKELGNPVPVEPLLFYKPPSSLIATGDDIVYPSFVQQMSFEGELTLVIGRQARHVEAHDWEHYVYGFTVVNDITARDLQKKDGQWARAKGCDTFCPCGPVIVPRTSLRFEDIRIKSWVNGQPKQDGSVRDMIFSPGAIIAFVTQFLTLEPGDLIATGTPPGVGPLEPGDTVKVEIEGIGALENKVIKG